MEFLIMLLSAKSVLGCEAGNSRYDISTLFTSDFVIDIYHNKICRFGFFVCFPVQVAIKREFKSCTNKSSKFYCDYCL